jgi:hypothetical protein
MCYSYADSKFEPLVHTIDGIGGCYSIVHPLLTSIALYVGAVYNSANSWFSNNSTTHGWVLFSAG